MYWRYHIFWKSGNFFEKSVTQYRKNEWIEKKFKYHNNIVSEKEKYHKTPIAGSGPVYIVIKSIP